MSRALEDLSPLMQPLVDAFMAAAAGAGLDLLVTCTSRTLAEQSALYAQGRTAPGRIVTDAPAGESAHNFGLAIDIVPIVNGKPDWQGADPVWKQAGALGVAAGLVWAGSPGFAYPEEPHFELADWRRYATPR